MISENDRRAAEAFVLCGVEEDGDEVFTAMPEVCGKWTCKQKGGNRLVKNERGFMVCPVCGGSYGKA